MALDDLELDTLRVRRIEIVDSNDLTRGLITTGANGTVGLVLLDETKKQRVALTHTVDQKSMLEFKSASGEPRLSAAASENGTCGVTIHGEDGVVRATMHAPANGNSCVTICDRNGQPRVSMQVLTDYTVQIMFTDDATAPKMILSITPDGLPHLIRVNENGQAQGF